LEEGSPVDRKDVSDRINELLSGLKQSAAVTDQENTLALARTDAEFAIKAVQMALTRQAEASPTLARNARAKINHWKRGAQDAGSIGGRRPKGPLDLRPRGG
jgi:hypothetical protein